MTRNSVGAAGLALCALALLLSGCATSFAPTDDSPVAASMGAISGTAFGGRQPIAGAHVYLLQVSSSAYGGPTIAATSGNKSTDLLTSGDGSDSVGEYVLTSSIGAFSFNGHTTSCTSGEQVYVYAVGGKPDGVTANSLVGEMAVLGTCGSSFTSATSVNMNEVSTIAAAYAMAGFATDAAHVGYSGTALGRLGILNAFANANQMYDITSNPQSNPNTVARTTTPGSGTVGGTGTVPQSQIDTLANILSACVNSSGSGSTQCGTLFSDMLSFTGGTASDTADIALYMAQNSTALVSGTSKVSAVYGITGSAPNPYTPWYNSTTPTDFAVQLVFTGAGLTTAYEDFQDVVVDASGNIWVTSGQGTTLNTSGTVLSGYNHLGVPLKSGGYTSLGLSFPQGMAVDLTNTYLWITNSDDANIVKFTLSNGTVAATYNTGSIPLAVAIDSAGYPWVMNYGSGNVQKLDPNAGTVLKTLTGNGMSANTPQDLAIKPGTLGDIWVTNNGGTSAMDTVSAFTNSGSVVGDSASLNHPGPIAFDAAGDAFALDQTENGVNKFSGTVGSTSNYGDGGGFTDAEDAVDGANRVWVSSSDASGGGAHPEENAMFMLSSSTVAITNGAGYRALPDTQPDSMAIDGSGNIWFNSQSDATLHEMIGAAVPVVTPLSVATANNKLGVQP